MGMGMAAASLPRRLRTASLEWLIFTCSRPDPDLEPYLQQHACCIFMLKGAPLSAQADTKRIRAW